MGVGADVSQQWQYWLEYWLHPIGVEPSGIGWKPYRLQTTVAPPTPVAQRPSLMPPSKITPQGDALHVGHQPGRSGGGVGPGGGGIGNGGSSGTLSSSLFRTSLFTSFFPASLNKNSSFLSSQASEFPHLLSSFISAWVEGVISIVETSPWYQGSYKLPPSYPYRTDNESIGSYAAT